MAGGSARRGARLSALPLGRREAPLLLGALALALKEARRLRPAEPRLPV